MVMSAATGNTALDVAIGLAFVYLLFSVLCAAVQEFIAGIFDMRAATLERGLRNLLDDSGGANMGGAPAAVPPAPPPTADAGAVPLQPSPRAPSLAEQVLGHGLIRTLYKDSRVLFRRRRRGPSYIPSRSFALALLNVVAPMTSAEDRIADVRTNIARASIPAGTKSALLSLANGAAQDRDQLRALIEQWFDGSMSRVSGWYKRKTQIIICVLSLLVAVGLNVNTVSIADRLIHDDAVRAAVVQQATRSAAKAGDSLDEAAARVSAVERLGLPLGWNKPEADPVRPDLSDHFARTAGGWLLTFLALSLGAPFWFDALSKLAGLRSSGRRPSASGAAG
jgi:hypothetical protein